MHAAAFGALQVVDGVALKRAVDQWYAAPAEMKPTAFASALTARWTEYGLNSLTWRRWAVREVAVPTESLPPCVARGRCSSESATSAQADSWIQDGVEEVHD